MPQTLNREVFYTTLDRLFQQGDGSAIRAFLESAMTTARADEDAAGQIVVANELGGWYRAQGHLQEAKDLYKGALRLIERIGEAHTDNHATTLVNAGDVYVADRQYDEALRLFLEAETILTRLGMERDYRMAALQNNISAVYREQGAFEKAAAALEIALTIITALPQAKSEEATTLINLAQLRTKQGKFDEAEAHLSRAIGIYETALQGKDPHYAMALAAFGEVAYYQGDYPRAEEYYTQALEKIEALFGRSPVYDTVAANVARIRQLRSHL